MNKIDTQIKGKADKVRVKLIIDRLKDNEGPYRITVDKDRRTRSNPQNRLYRKYIKILADEVGPGVEEMALLIKEKFLVMRIYEKKEGIRKSVDALRELKKHSELRAEYRALRQAIIEGVSTTDLNTKEMKEYTDDIREWAQDYLNITLPVPDDLRTGGL